MLTSFLCLLVIIADTLQCHLVKQPGATVKDQTFEFKAESKSYMLPCDAHNGVAMVCGDAFEEQSDCQPGTW